MDMRRDLLRGFGAAVEAVDAPRATGRAVPRLGLGSSPVLLLALGKAAAGMARGFCTAHVGPVRGLVVGAEIEPVPRQLSVMVGDHPVPTERSLAAGRALLEAAATARPEETVVVLVSGGGSALAEALIDGVDLADLQVLTRTLLRSGRPIHDVNAVRIAVSRLKGGGLAAVSGGRRIVTLAISDVSGDDPGLIASGPTVASDVSPTAAVVVAALGDAIPESVRTAVRAGTAQPRATGAAFEIVAGRVDAAAAAGAQLREDGWSATVVEPAISGEAARLAPHLIAAALRGTATVYSGETTVTVRGAGRGGRNQEAALAAALVLDGRDDMAFLAAGTDGIDGMTDAAGAVVDGDTVREGRRCGLDATALLADNDAGRYFESVSGRVVTGRTGTNVGDIWIVVRR